MSIVSIIGRPNVGKSTIFNRFTESRSAITCDISGTTRDRNYGECIWNGVTFTIVDTGGYIFNDLDNTINRDVNKQIEIAIKESDLILFVVDAKDGLTGEDKDIANILRKHKGLKKIILVVNKSDNYKLDFASYEFMKLGFDDLFKISAISGYGTGELLDYVVSNLNKPNNQIEGTIKLPKFAIIGQPNVGKSLLTNVLLGEERNIVSDIPGTTREPNSSEYKLFNKNFILVDTAGIRNKLRNLKNIEFYSMLRSIKALEQCDVCIYVIDAVLNIESKDLKLINLAVKNRKGIVIVVNKCDLIDKDTYSINLYRKKIYERLRNCSFIPIIFVSALKKHNIFKIVEKGMEVYENKTNKIKTSELNNVLLPIIAKTPPMSRRCTEIKIKYVTQLPTDDITFVFFCNRPNEITQEYKSFLRNKIYESFKLGGVSFSILFKSK